MIVRKKIMLAISLLAVAGFGQMGCVEKEVHHREGLRGYHLVVNMEGGDGSVESPLKYADKFYDSEGVCPSGHRCQRMEIGALAYNVDGSFRADESRMLRVKIRPGGDVSPEFVEMKDGKVGEWRTNEKGEQELVKGVTVNVRYAYDESRVWLEDNVERYKDEKGLDVSQETHGATAVSQIFTFEPVTISKIQYNPEAPAGWSPMTYRHVDLNARKGHDLVVTNIVSTGFYLADLSEKEYESLFVFTFKQPERMQIGDRVCELTGGVTEFNGMTQMQFPSWGIQNRERSSAAEQEPVPEDDDADAKTCKDKVTGEVRQCTREELDKLENIVDCSAVYNNGVPLKGDARKKFGVLTPPPAKILNPAVLLENPDAREKLESMEGSVVTAKDVRLSTYFINCDDNGNLKIESKSPEADCRSRCTSNPNCTELSNMYSYDQWRGWTGNGEISVASTSLVSGFNILEGCTAGVSDDGFYRTTYQCPERTFKRITGTLRQVIPTCKPDQPCDAATSKFAIVVLEPRFSADIVQ